MPGTHSPNNSPAAGIWAATRESSSYFSHTVALRAGLVVMLGVASVTLWLMMQLPFVNVRMVVSLLPLVLCGYLAHRLYLTLTVVEFFADRLEIRLLGNVVSLPYESIRKIYFDSLSHDLLVRDDSRQYRIPRTIQGHRVILHRLHAHVEVERDHSPEMKVEVRLLPKVACGLSIAAMMALSLMVSMAMPRVGICLLLFCLPSAYMLLDQCILRSYLFMQGALHVKGLRGVKVYRRDDLKDTWITKSELSGRFQMTFSSGKVQFDEYLLSKALIQVTGYVERRWEQRVTPLAARG